MQSNQVNWGFHGDVVFIQQPKLPKGGKIKKTKIIQGSQTPGHEHIIKKGSFEIREYKQDGKITTYLKALTKVTLGMNKARNKHRDVIIPKGVNVLWKQTILRK
jgi:hypothetical protein